MIKCLEEREKTNKYQKKWVFKFIFILIQLIQISMFFFQNAMANYMFISGQGPQKDNFSSDHGLQFSFWCLGPEMNM